MYSAGHASPARTPTRAMQRAKPCSSAGSSSTIGGGRRAVVVSVAIVGRSQQSAQ